MQKTEGGVNIKIKEIIIICLIMCFIFSLQALGAADVDADDTNGTALATADASVVKQGNDTSSLTLQENTEVLGEDPGSFTDLAGQITGTDVTLTRNYTYNEDSDSGLTGGIEITQSVTIQGSGNIVIDASHKARVFNIASGATVTLRGITFINGNADGNGGAITSDGVLIIDECTFKDNTATGHGGAVYLGVSSGDKVTNSEFTGNTAGLNGGAIDWRLGSFDGLVAGSVFENNVANRSGGAIHWSGHYGTISNSNFTNNRAVGTCSTEFGGVVGGGDGGAVLWVGSHGIIKDNCNFNNNYAKNRGGAIFLHGNSTENCTNTTVTYSHFEKNVAGLNGGAIDWQKGATDGILSHSTFINNTAWRSGGAVYWNGLNGTVSYCDFKYNDAVGNVTGTDFPFATYQTPGGNGGAIIWTGALGDVDHSNFTNNTAAVLGGAVYLQGSTSGPCINTTFDSCRFINNTAGSNGGAIDWKFGAENGKVLNSVFINNTASRSGGAIHWSGHYGIISNSNFTNNRAIGTCSTVIGGFAGGGDGGAVLWVGSHGIIKDNCIFTDNFAKYRGGAIFLHGNSTENCTNTTVTHCTFKDNVAGLNGGAVDWQHGSHDGVLTYSTFTNNTAWRSGGAVYWYGINGTIKYCDFTDNHAIGNKTKHDNETIANYTTNGGNGGAVIWTGSEGEVDHCNFTRNTAARLGGAVYLQQNSNVNFYNSHFTSNNAGYNGGAIHFNTGATNGGVNNCTFESNVANRSAGAIFWIGTHGHILNSNFTNNKALGGVSGEVAHNGTNTTGGSGGAIIWAGSDAELIDCIFTNNTAAKRGGALFLESTKESLCKNVTIKDSTFKNNLAAINGGAVAWDEGAEDGVMDNITFTNNTAWRNGGAIYWNGQNGTIKNSRFTNNRATGTNWEYTFDLNMGNTISVNGNITTLGNIIVIKGNNLTHYYPATPTSSEEIRLFVLNYTVGTTQRFESYVAHKKADGTYEWKLLDETNITISESFI